MKEYTDECIRGGLDYHFYNDDDDSNSDDFDEMEDYPFPPQSELAFSFANRKDTIEQRSDERSHDIDNDLVVLNAEEDLATTHKKQSALQHLSSHH